MNNEYIDHENQLIERLLDLLNKKIKNKQIKQNVTKYQFNSNSNSSCYICMEKFKATKSMCINSCYHYWCKACNDNITNNKCGLCDTFIHQNEFIQTFGKSGHFQKKEFELEVINIIKEDIESIDSSDFHIETNELNINLSKLKIDLEYLNSLD